MPPKPPAPFSAPSRALCPSAHWTGHSSRKSQAHLNRTMLKLNLPSSSTPATPVSPISHHMWGDQARGMSIHVSHSSLSINFPVLLILALNVSQISPHVPCPLSLWVQVCINEWCLDYWIRLLTWLPASSFASLQPSFVFVFVFCHASWLAGS